LLPLLKVYSMYLHELRSVFWNRFGGGCQQAFKNWIGNPRTVLWWRVLMDSRNDDCWKSSWCRVIFSTSMLSHPSCSSDVFICTTVLHLLCLYTIQHTNGHVCMYVCMLNYSDQFLSIKVCCFCVADGCDHCRSGWWFHYSAWWCLITPSSWASVESHARVTESCSAARAMLRRPCLSTPSCTCYSTCNAGQRDSFCIHENICSTSTGLSELFDHHTYSPSTRHYFS